VNGQPDKSDSNTITRNVIGPHVGSEPIQALAGVTGTVVTRNRINRAGVHYTGQIVGAIFHTGNGGRDSANVIFNVSGTDNGVYIETSLTGWGQNTRTTADTITGTNVTGYGYRVGGGSKATTRIDCSGVVTGFTGYSTMSPVCSAP